MLPSLASRHPAPRGDSNNSPAALRWPNVAPVEGGGPHEVFDQSMRAVCFTGTASRTVFRGATIGNYDERKNAVFGGDPLARSGFERQLCGRSIRRPAQFEVHGGRRQLFLDDAGVDRIDNLTRSLHRPHKRGAVLRSPQPSQTVQIRTSPVWVPERRRWLLWVNGIEPTVWESNDALNWQSVRSSNLRVEMVVYDPLDRDPQRRFKAALENSGFAVSPDGMTWKAPRRPCHSQFG